MIVDERIVTYMHSLEKPNNNVLEEIEQQAHIDGVPIIRKEMESFLRVMLTITKPKRILELGTAVGYSAILMSEAIEKDASIITIENYEKRIVQARDNFKKADKEDVITMLEGDAMEIMPGLEGDSFDFVFMDAAKAQYIHFLPEVMRLMKKGAVLITDNVLQENCPPPLRTLQDKKKAGNPRRFPASRIVFGDYLLNSATDFCAAATLSPAVTFLRASIACGFISLALYAAPRMK